MRYSLVLAADLPVETVRMWWIALGAGLVVAIALVALLHLLLTRVRQVEQGVAEVWRAGGHVARNTAAAWMLDRTAGSLEGLEAEADLHAEHLREGSA